jgi:triacylglycerol lipase
MNEDTSFEALTNPGKADNFFSGIDNLPAFDPQASRSYARGNALWLMETCRLIYREDEPSRKNFFEQRAGLHETKFFNTGDTQGGLVRGNGFAVLAFRGTLGERDWLADFDFPPVNWEGDGKVHGGFKKQLDAVWAEVKQELDQVDGPVFYAGHSLGAALATLAAARRFIENGTPPVALYSFGSPRVGTAGFMHAFPDDFLHCRVVNDLDVVPTVPPRLFKRDPFRLEYHHVGIPHHIDHDGQLRRGKPNDDDDGVFGSFSGFVKGLGFWRDRLKDAIHTRGASLTERFTDHAPVNYTARIEKAGDLP